MAGRAYLFAVQDENGREVLSATIDGLERVSEVSAYERHNEADDSYTVVIDWNGVEVDFADSSLTSELTLHRWPADDKLARPVSHKVAEL